jgi:hypothetical protein
MSIPLNGGEFTSLTDARQAGTESSTPGIEMLRIPSRSSDQKLDTVVKRM